jgi:hypothetical protein
MEKEEKSAARAAADRIVELEAELETAANATVDNSTVEKARTLMIKWLDGVAGVVASPALGRVTLIHSNGRMSTINSPDLAYLITGPVNKAQAG